MGTSFRFHRRLRLGSFFRLNLNKRSVSLTGGGRRGGPHVTSSTNGSTTTSVGLPGTGLSVVNRTPPKPGRWRWRRILEKVGIHTTWGKP